MSLLIILDDQPQVNITDAVHVSESVTVKLSPLLINVSDSVHVGESFTSTPPGTLSFGAGINGLTVIGEPWHKTPCDIHLDRGLILTDRLTGKRWRFFVQNNDFNAELVTDDSPTPIDKCLTGIGSGTPRTAEDIEITKANNGFVFKDRTTGKYYRMIFQLGFISLELTS